MENSKSITSLYCKTLTNKEMNALLGGNVPVQSGSTQDFCTGWTGPDANGNTTFDMRSTSGAVACGLDDHGSHPEIGDEV